jgi:pyridoxal/pyridoxine/pyridoxamine kinase
MNSDNHTIRDSFDLDVSGSISLSKIVTEIVKHNQITKKSKDKSVYFNVSGNLSFVDGCEQKPSVRVGAGDFFLALAGAGAVGEALLERAIQLAADRAAKNEDEEEYEKSLSTELVEKLNKLKTKSDKLKTKYCSDLPKVNKPATVRFKGKVSL